MSYTLNHIPAVPDTQPASDTGCVIQQTIAPSGLFNNLVKRGVSQAPCLTS